MASSVARTYTLIQSNSHLLYQGSTTCGRTVQKQEVRYNCADLPWTKTKVEVDNIKDAFETSSFFSTVTLIDNNYVTMGKSGLEQAPVSNIKSQKNLAITEVAVDIEHDDWEIINEPRYASVPVKDMPLPTFRVGYNIDDIGVALQNAMATPISVYEDNDPYKMLPRAGRCVFPKTRDMPGFIEKYKRGNTQDMVMRKDKPCYGILGIRRWAWGY